LVVVDDKGELVFFSEVVGMNKVLKKLCHGSHVTKFNVYTVRSNLVLVWLSRVEFREVSWSRVIGSASSLGSGSFVLWGGFLAFVFFCPSCCRGNSLFLFLFTLF